MCRGYNLELFQCNRRVRNLCNKAAAGVSYHGKCTKKNNAVLFSGGDINTYIQSSGLGHGVHSKNEITTEVNAVEEDKEYYVCANLKKKIVDAVDARKRTSGQLNPEARTPIVITDKTSLQVVFNFDNRQEEYKEVTYNDELEDDKERFSRIGYCTSLPKQVLMYKPRKPFGNINYRQKQRRNNNIVKELLASSVDCKQL